jgi:uncharacterized protein involved in type VI secretion and phage assembly
MDMPAVQSRIGASQERFYGKYRGVVVDNSDPEGRGRLQVKVQEVRGTSVVDWAMPASPYAGDGVGFFALPPVDANVWVEYEAGNLRVPIWSGCFWERGQIDAADAVPDVMFLKTKAASLRIDSASGEVRIEVSGSKITITASEIKIEASQITNSASGASVQLTAGGFDVLQGALKVV